MKEQNKKKIMAVQGEVTRMQYPAIDKLHFTDWFVLGQFWRKGDLRWRRDGGSSGDGGNMFHLDEKDVILNFMDPLSRTTRLLQ
ncbi:hypothetical protein Bpfe_013345 [Biomphalaria pfeifferi]|uniref:Uncharacterized protein n=1 Tax=Biomphalaria pfeifferi TaxID=112525 RepID=A0AAD8BM94_BIOPF|nr:hypothetical protein Bpfe_013345 [Biomphalaria pfeifferi]